MGFQRCGGMLARRVRAAPSVLFCILVVCIASQLLLLCLYNSLPQRRGDTNVVGGQHRDEDANIDDIAREEHVLHAVLDAKPLECSSMMMHFMAYSDEWWDG